MVLAGPSAFLMSNDDAERAGAQRRRGCAVGRQRVTEAFYPARMDVCAPAIENAGEAAHATWWGGLQKDLEDLFTTAVDDW